jgi:Na+/H+ antiporter NhaC
MDKPGRMPAIIIASALFMIAAVMFGEGNKLLHQEKAPQNDTTVTQPSTEVPATAPVTAPITQ